MNIKSVYLWENGMVMTFGMDGEQIQELQGCYSIALVSKIWERSNKNTEWHGFPPNPPCVWNPTNMNEKMS